MNVQSRGDAARPFLKWAGGKGQLLWELLACVAAAGEFGRYHEPFVGGGALFFGLVGSLSSRRKACLSDNNRNLIDCYLGLQKNVEGVIELLKAHKARHGEDYFYEVRSAAPATLEERAARVIYLNRTCFNGLYRENSRGGFNVPFGRYKNPTICDAENLRACAKALKRAVVEQRPFEAVLKRARAGDFVYFDPPYVPVSATSNFTSYDKGGFGEDSQRRLAEVFAELAQRGVKVLLSNSETPLVRELYRGFEIETVYATRRVNSRADRRGKVPEVLVRNF
jgi:DNA adenine methylase